MVGVGICVGLGKEWCEQEGGGNFKKRTIALFCSFYRAWEKFSMALVKVLF